MLAAYFCKERVRVHQMIYGLTDSQWLTYNFPQLAVHTKMLKPVVTGHIFHTFSGQWSLDLDCHTACAAERQSLSILLSLGIPLPTSKNSCPDSKRCHLAPDISLVLCPLCEQCWFFDFFCNISDLVACKEYILSAQRNSLQAKKHSNLFKGRLSFHSEGRKLTFKFGARLEVLTLSLTEYLVPFGHVLVS